MSVHLHAVRVRPRWGRNSRDWCKACAATVPRRVMRRGWRRDPPILHRASPCERGVRFPPRRVRMAVASCSALADQTVEKLDERLTRSSEVFRELLATPDRGVPKELLERAKCVAVLPHVVKGAIVYGVKAGSGVMSCRDASGGWSAPSFITLR